MVLFFLSYDTKISGLLKVSCLCPDIYSVCLKIFRLIQILGMCLEISITGLKILMIQKYYICFLSNDPKNFQIAESFRRVSGNFGHVLETFKITKTFKHLSGNFQRVSEYFILNKDNIIFLTNDTKKF